MLFFLKSQGSKDKYTNTNSQIHKYSLWWSAANTQHVLYFGKAKVPRTSEMIFLTVKYTKTNAQIQKYKFTKRQIHKYNIRQNARNTQRMLHIFLNSWRSKDVKNDDLKCSDPRYSVDVQTFARSHQVYYWLAFLLVNISLELHSVVHNWLLSSVDSVGGQVQLGYASLYLPPPHQQCSEVVLGVHQTPMHY